MKETERRTNMKKLISAFSVMALTLSMAACSNADQTAVTESGNTETDTEAKPQEALTSEADPKEENAALSGTLPGGWQTNSSYSELLKDEERDIFAKAAEGLTGASCNPVTVVADQVVSGTNYAYLCQGRQVTGTDHGAWYIVTVYSNTENEAQINNVYRMDISDMPVSDNAGEALSGGWNIRGSGKPGALSEEGEAALSKAAEGFTGVSLMPIVLLGTQTVSGMNFRYLCYGTTVTQEPKTSLYVVTVYRNTEGKCEIIENTLLDLNTCVSSEEE